MWLEQFVWGGRHGGHTNLWESQTEAEELLPVGSLISHGEICLSDSSTEDLFTESQRADGAAQEEEPLAGI